MKETEWIIPVMVFGGALLLGFGIWAIRMLFHQQPRKNVYIQYIEFYLNVKINQLKSKKEMNSLDLKQQTIEELNFIKGLLELTMFELSNKQY